MPLQVAIGFSQDKNPEVAAKNAAFEAKSNLGADRIDAAVVFSTIHYDPHRTVPIIQRVLNNAPMLGTSTTGIILSNGIKTSGLAVLAMSSDTMKFGLGTLENINPHEPYPAGLNFTKNCLEGFGMHARHLFLFFMDGHLDNNSPMLKGMQEVLGNVFPMVGAGSSDDFHFKRTFQIHNNRVLKHAAVGLIFGGSLNLGIGSRHGWRPLGKPRLIEEANGHIIKTIDGKKASKLYEEYFGRDITALQFTKLGQMSILYPLGIFVEGSKEYLLRNVVDIMNDGSIVCQGEVPTDSEVHIMIGNKESSKQAALEAAREARENLLGKEPKLLLIIESMARLKLLGRSAYQEIEKVKQVFGENIPIIGMFSNGEIYPFQALERFKKPHFQNESITILAMG